MPKKVPKRNVEPVLVDVKKPDFNYEVSNRFSSLNLRRISGEYKKKKGISWRSILKWGGGVIAVLLIILGIFAALNMQSAKMTLEAKGESVSAYLFESLESMKNFKTGEAKDSLVKSKKKLDEINSMINSDSENFILSAGFKVVPFLKNIGGFLKQATQFNIDLIHLSGVLNDIQHNGFSYFRNDGEKLLKLMREARSLVGKIKSEVGSLRNKAEGMGKIAHFGGMEKALEDKYFVYSNQLYVIEDFLDGMIGLFDSEKPQHVLLMFQNSSEIRPAGGFLGSYGDLIIKNGEMEKLVVEDIYWPDHPMNFDEKYIPPEPLQRVTKDWGARDANWFFDFPTSAEVVMTMLEHSKIYEEKDIEFEGVIGINVDVLGTMMKYVGEIKLPQYDMTVSDKNFLVELQREVEVGQDKQAGKNPKKILAVLAPKIIERLENLSDEEMRKMLEDLSEHVEKKDIMFYVEDEKITGLFQKNGVAGEVYELPDGFWGSYLAVVNSNVGGGKSDAFVDQEINLWLNVNAEGGVVGDLEVMRKHNGEGKEYSWYRADNKDYLKVYTNPSSELIFSKGSTERYKTREEYDSSYKKLEALEKIEATKTYNGTHNVWTTKEFGKEAFATWLVTPAGEKSKLEMRYNTPTEKNFQLKAGRKFRFVFDKQSGSDTDLNVKISAPLGFVWAESGSSVYKYETDNPEKRVKIDLTLKNQFEEEMIRE